MSRINFVSFTFLFAFGLGSFVGIAMALLAVALARPADEPRVVEQEPVAVADSPTPRPTGTPAPTGTPTPEPLPLTSTALQVRIGPATGYAVLGTLAAGSELDLQGRDDTGDWVAIEFPPGSLARGWIPFDNVDGLSVVEVLRLDVLQASLIETTPRLPFVTSTPTLLEGNDGLPNPTLEVEGTPTPTPTPTPALGLTPSPTSTPSPVDVAIGGVSLSIDGFVNIVVRNFGPGAVTAVVKVIVGEEVEQLSVGPLAGGANTIVRTSGLHITETTVVEVTVDPNSRLEDTDRRNNTRTVTLTP